MRKAAFLFCGILFLTRALSAQAPAPLVIDYQFNVTAPDAENYLTFSGPHRYGRAGGNKMDVTKDNFDTVSGASRYQSTAIFSIAYQNDIAQKTSFPGGVRGLLLYPVASDSIRTDDVLTVNKAGNGVITVQYVHRGYAYRITTDNQGRLSFPRGNYQVRQIGFISAAGPQVIARDFSSTGEAAQIDWAKVWDTKIQAGRPIESLSRANGTVPANVTTGAITNDWENSTIFQFFGFLQFTWDGKILKISGSLTPKKGTSR
jgi:hypothetical protein